MALPFALADIARSRGKKIEEQIAEQICDELGGKPSVAMLRHSDTSTFDVRRGVESKLHWISLQQNNRVSTK